ncbi:MAG: DDE-type integrase/transposase/recombinase [Firmicutes bacterium]|nr:DDE-type integrase/transposase/recombinase [Bacillota bacterium]
MKGVKYTAREKQAALKQWIEEGKHWFAVCKKFMCNRISLWRWKKQYDGTLESLENKSSRPHTPHPNSHTDKEIGDIKRLLKQNPAMGYTELYGELRTRCAYSRHYLSMYKVIRKLRIRPAELYDEYIPQPYDTPLMLGLKWQMDVKYVPHSCMDGYAKQVGDRHFQYTIIDEATRERFIYAYAEQSGYSTCDFIRRAILYFGYIPKCIQTDNGTEFTTPKGTHLGIIHIADKLMNRLGIKHQLIQAYTPRHNGKVERSHRTDQEKFYNYLTYENFDELNEKMADWLIRYNKTPSTVLRDRNGKRAMQSPLDKRTELIEILKETANTQKIRFIKIRRKFIQKTSGLPTPLGGNL